MSTSPQSINGRFPALAANIGEELPEPPFSVRFASAVEFEEGSVCLTSTAPINVSSADLVAEVEDVPFLVVALTVEGEGREQQLIFRTNLDEFVTAGPDNPLRVETAASGEPSPYILIRDALEARLARPVFYDLVELGIEEQVGDTRQFGVWSRGAFFWLGEPGPDWE